MPHYQYVCNHCGAKLEIFQSMRDKPIAKCSSCRNKTLVRQIGTGLAAFVKNTQTPCRGSMQCQNQS